MEKQSEPNEYGVYSEEGAEHLHYATKKASADIFLRDTGHGWLYACRGDHRQGSMAGFSHPMTEASGNYVVRDGALKAAAIEIIRHEKRVLDDTGSCVTDDQKKEAAKIIEWAEQFLKPVVPVVKQAELF